MRRLAPWVAVAIVGFLVFEYVTLPDVEGLAKENPKTTALIEQRAEEARAAGKKPRRRQSWVSLDGISRHAVDAVVLAEDASFYLHEGIDTVELRKALEEAIAKGKLGRGASTITQQLAKNLWLSTERSLLRKVKELVLARRLDAQLPKKRVLALYLNVVEWGDGVYGIEAASLEHFGVHARALSAAQGATLAAMLPAPRRRIPKLRGRNHYKYADRILGRMRAGGRLDADGFARAHQELAELFGVSGPPVGETPSDEGPTGDESPPEAVDLSDPGVDEAEAGEG